MAKQGYNMLKLSILDALQRRWKRSIPPDVLKTGSMLNVREGEEIVITYTSAADKMKVFSTFIREGLENGDAAFYVYPDEENATARAKLREQGIDVEKCEKDGALYMYSLTEFYEPNGKLDYSKVVTDSLKRWAEIKGKGYKHIRDIEDIGDFSFVGGQWQRWIIDYWLDPRWEDPNTLDWVVPSITAINAINVEHMTEKQVNEILKALGRARLVPERAFIDLIEFIDSLSGSIGLNHEQLVGRKILLEYDPAFNYESVANRLAKESMANVEPIFVFTSRTSPVHAHLTEQPAVKFFLTSITVSTPEAISENEALLPTKNIPLILEAVGNVLENYANANVSFVFDILSDLLATTGPEKTLTFMNRVLDMIASVKITGLFLLNTNAHEPKVVSRMRELLPNILTYDKDGLRVVKLLGS